MTDESQQTINYHLSITVLTEIEKNVLGPFLIIKICKVNYLYN